MLEKLEGIILNERDYSESSKILDILTKKYGIISVIAKGCRKVKSPLCSVSSKLNYGIIEIYYKENKLSILSSIDIINSFSNIRKDIIKVSVSSYLIELVTQTIKQIQNNDLEIIYNNFIDSIIKIEDGFDPIVIKNILETKYLNHLGVNLLLDKCIKCGTQENIVTLSLENNGLLCKECLDEYYVNNIDIIKYIRMYNYIDISKISKIEIEKEIIKQINMFLEQYYEKYTGLYFISKKVLNNINIWGD